MLPLWKDKTAVAAHRANPVSCLLLDLLDCLLDARFGQHVVALALRHDRLAKEVRNWNGLFGQVLVFAVEEKRMGLLGARN